jgi:cellulose synthase/poly-beta-1,6-N-acetylglucosamine synthase-like glycosyltransferase
MFDCMKWPASILVPVLRQDDEYLEQSVRSACDQTVPCEVIVTRTTGTPTSNVAVLERLSAVHPQIRVVEVDLGLARGLNTAIRSAQADRVGFLMSDDWLQPDAIASCLPGLARKPARRSIGGQTGFLPDPVCPGRRRRCSAGRLSRPRDPTGAPGAPTLDGSIAGGARGIEQTSLRPAQVHDCCLLRLRDASRISA